LKAKVIGLSLKAKVINGCHCRSRSLFDFICSQGHY